MIFLVSPKEWLKAIFPIAIFVGLSSWAIFYFAGKFWGFVWLGFWAFLFVLCVLLVIGYWRCWWGRKIIYHNSGGDWGGKVDMPKFKPKP